LLSASGLELGDALAPRISIIELDDPSARRPPQPAPDVEGGLGSGPWGPLAVIEAPLCKSDLAGLWDPVGRVITFWEPVAGIAVELRDGDYVGFAGGGTDLAGDLPWLARADEACPREAFGVGMLGAVDGQRLSDLEPSRCTGG